MSLLYCRLFLTIMTVMDDRIDEQSDYSDDDEILDSDEEVNVRQMYIQNHNMECVSVHCVYRETKFN